MAAQADKTVPVYSPETDEILAVPQGDVKLYQDAGYKTGTMAQSAMDEEHSKTPIVAAANAIDSIGFGVPKRLLNRYSPETAKLLEQYEEERPIAKIAGNAAGYLVPGLGIAKGVRALGLAGKSLMAAQALTAAAQASVTAGNEVVGQSEVDNTPLSNEQLATSMGIAGLIGVAAEFVPAAVMKRLATSSQRATAATLERAAESPAFKKTVLDPVTEAYKPRVEPTPGATYTVGDALPGEQLFGDAAAESAPAATNSATAPPSVPISEGGLPPTLAGDEFNFAPDAFADNARAADVKVQNADFWRKTAPEQSQQLREALAQEAAGVDKDFDRELATAHPEYRPGLRADREQVAADYARRLRPLPPIPEAPAAAEAALASKPPPLPASVAEEAAATRAELDLPSDFKRPRPPRMPTARQLGKQLLRDAPLPDLPSEGALADSAAMKGLTDELPATGAAPSQTIFEYAPGQAPGDYLKRAAGKAAHGVINPLSWVTGHHALFSGAAAMPDLLMAGKQAAQMALLTHRAAVQGIVDYMAAGPAKAIGITAKSLLQGTAANVASNYLPGNLDENYQAVADGVSKLAANPEQINQYYQQRWGPMFTDKPEVLGNVVRIQTQKIQHLSELLPRSSSAPAIYSDAYKPSRSDMLSYLARYKAVNDPMGALANPTSDVIESVKATNPALYQELTTILHGQLAQPNTRKKLSPQAASAISNILGVNVRPSDDPTFIAGLQQVAQSQTQAQAQAQQPQPAQGQGAAVKPINLGKQQQSFVSSVAAPSQQHFLDEAGAM